MTSRKPIIFKHEVEGVAPIVDLGRWGTLVATLIGGGDRNGISQRRMFSVLYWLAPDRPRYAGRNPFPRLPKKSSPTTLYPGLRWLPPGTQDPVKFKKLFPDQFRSVIGNGVALRSIIIEPAPDAAFTERIENAPEWLWKFRRYNAPRDSELALERPRELEMTPVLQLPYFETDLPPSFTELETK